MAAPPLAITGRPVGADIHVLTAHGDSTGITGRPGGAKKHLLPAHWDAGVPRHLLHLRDATPTFQV